jgi:hypothetical protein
VDGSPHFNCKEVERFCEKWGIKLHIVPKYSLWVNGLVEGTHKILLHILARLCAPDVGEDVWNATKWEDLLRNWPDHLDEAVRIMNWRILPTVKYHPKELMLGRIVNASAESASVDVEAPAAADFETHMAYVAQQRLDGYAARVKYALSRKAAFDRKVLASRTGVVTFKKGELVQVANSVWDYTFKTLRKLIYYWSTPYRVRERNSHSYKLETLQGVPLSGEHSSRRLRAFVPKKGGRLEKEQAAFEAVLAPILEEEEVAEREAVEAERAAEVGRALE